MPFARRLLLCLGLATFTAVIPARADIYIYRLPDGTQVITDRKIKDKRYKLVRKNASVKGMGAVLAQGPARFFRDTTAYDRLIQRTAARYALDPALLKAVMHAESGFNPQALSPKGASGLMQLMPQTAQRFGVSDVFDPAQNVRGGARYLRILLRQFSGDARLALAAYNAGEHAVLRHQGIPPYPETRQYVRKVLSLRERYAHLQFAQTSVTAQ